VANDDRARQQHILLPVAEEDAVRFVVAVQSDGVLCDQDPRAELLRLIVGARRQLLARDAERKAEVVLDLRARPGLSARCVGLEH